MVLLSYHSLKIYTLLFLILLNAVSYTHLDVYKRQVLEWGADKPVIGKFFRFCLEKGKQGGEKLQEKAGRGLFIALLVFVGIPSVSYTHLIRGQSLTDQRKPFVI